MTIRFMKNIKTMTKAFLIGSKVEMIIAMKDRWERQISGRQKIGKPYQVNY